MDSIFFVYILYHPPAQHKSFISDHILNDYIVINTVGKSARQILEKVTGKSEILRLVLPTLGTI